MQHPKHKQAFALYNNAKREDVVFYEASKLLFDLFPLNSTNSKAVKAGKKKTKTLDTTEPAAMLRYRPNCDWYRKIFDRYRIAGPTVTPKSRAMTVDFPARTLLRVAMK